MPPPPIPPPPTESLAGAHVVPFHLSTCPTDAPIGAILSPVTAVSCICRVNTAPDAILSWSTALGAILSLVTAELAILSSVMPPSATDIVSPLIVIPSPAIRVTPGPTSSTPSANPAGMPVISDQSTELATSATLAVPAFIATSAYGLAPSS